jgi:CRISPR type III-B/RAMP module RAMP protein Cmr4
MFKEAGVLFLYTETPLHAGSGSSVAAVDLPIQRERHTQYPMIQGSGVKGAIRDLAEDRYGITAIKREIRCIKEKLQNSNPSEKEDLKKWMEELSKELDQRMIPIELVFGPEDGDRHGGALSFTDARILLFPVRSLKGVFAWITCPDVLSRLKKEAALAKNPTGWGDIKKPSAAGKQALVTKTTETNQSKVLIEIKDESGQTVDKKSRFRGIRF